MLSLPCFIGSISSVLTWRIPGTAEPGGLPSMESHRVGHDWSDLAAAAVNTGRTYLVVQPVQSWATLCEKVLVAQSCPTLWDPMDYSPPGSSVHDISQARILEWVAISFSRGSFWQRDQTCVSYLCIGRWVLYHLSHQGSLSNTLPSPQM